MALWMLRILVLTKSEPDDSLLSEDWFVKIMGGKIDTQPRRKGDDVSLVFQEVLKKIEKKPIRREGTLYTNIGRLAELVGLTAID